MAKCLRMPRWSEGQIATVPKNDIALSTSTLAGYCLYFDLGLSIAWVPRLQAHCLPEELRLRHPLCKKEW